jgi:hypothetical protein
LISQLGSSKLKFMVSVGKGYSQQRVGLVALRTCAIVSLWVLCSPKKALLHARLGYISLLIRFVKKFQRSVG